MIFKSQQSTMEGLQLIPQQYSKIYTTAFQSHDSIPITLNDLDIECQIWLQDMKIWTAIVSCSNTRMHDS